MKFDIIRKEQRGNVKIGWLNANHYFSFGTYYNPERMGFGKLKVINDDTIDPASGFDTHPHRNMEIITIPLQGSVIHKDSMGHSGEIKKGEVQVMSAGRGVRHSEHNASQDEVLKLFQIWIEPNEINVEPRYDQKTFSYQDKKDQWTQLISPMSALEESGIKIYQNAYINIAPLSEKSTIVYKSKEENQGLYVLVAKGQIKVGKEVLKARDAMSITGVSEVKVEAQEISEVLILEVPLDEH